MINHQKIYRSLLASLLLLALLLSLVSCKSDTEQSSEAVYYTVTFDSNGGNEIASKRILSGELIPEPDVPQREGFIFIGWMNGNIRWDFSTHKVTSDLTLCADWVTAESMFAYEILEESDTARITQLKKNASRIPIPSVIAGFPVSAIGDEVFADMLSGTTNELLIPKSVTSVGNRAFFGLSGVTISFEEGCALTEIGDEAFSGCTALKSIPLGEGLREIGAWCFSDCTALTSVVLPQSVSAIRENAFSGCSALQSVVMSANVTIVEDSAFEDCDKFKVIYFVGSAEQIESILQDGVHSMNDPLLNATVYLYAEQEPAQESEYGYWHWNEKKKPKLW